MALQEMEQISLRFCERKKCLIITAVCLIVGIVIVSLVARFGQALRGRNPPNQEWWKTTIFYQIYPRSFKDSNDDGIGDLKGIISELDYFNYLNVKALWISPFYESPMKDFGYDVSNHTRVDPTFGSVKDFEVLIQKAHEKDIKVIIDFLPNHTSDKHKWFQRSIKWTNPCRDYYVWNNGRTLPNKSKTVPNNWLGAFTGSAWTYSNIRGQYYYHAYLREQPDLNYRSQDVVKEMENVLRFWLDRGVDGFRLDSISKLLEANNTSLNEPRSNDSEAESFQYSYLRHDYTVNQPGIRKVVEGWRTVLDEYTKDGEPKFMVAEAVIKNNTERNLWYTYGADMPFNFALAETLKPECGGTCIHDVVKREYADLPEDAWPNFVLGSHDQKRVSSRKGEMYVNALNMLLLTLRGTPTTYYGEEIGMLDITPSYNQSQDPRGKVYGPEHFLEYSRDPARSPMQWDDTYQAGFTNSSNPWLPVSENYTTINVQAQRNSTLITPIKIYRKLAILREEPSFTYGRLIFSVVNDNVFSYVRKATGFSPYLIAINFGNKSSIDNYSQEPVNSLYGEIVANTANFDTEEFDIKKQLSLENMRLGPGQGLVLKF